MVCITNVSESKKKKHTKKPVSPRFYFCQIRRRRKKERKIICGKDRDMLQARRTMNNEEGGLRKLLYRIESYDTMLRGKG
jgi:hypothetical protein